MSKRRDMRLSEVEYREHAARVTRWQQTPIADASKGAARVKVRPESSLESIDTAPDGLLTGRLGKWGNVP